MLILWMYARAIIASFPDIDLGLQGQFHTLAIKSYTYSTSRIMWNEKKDQLVNISSEPSETADSAHAAMTKE
jgi:hypothetical protein